MNAVDRLLATARAEIGYLEKRSNSQLNDKTSNAGYNNYTKYAADLDKLGDIYNGPKNGHSWCDVFVDWCFVKAFGKELGVKMLYQPLKGLGAGCTYSARYFRQHGAFFKTPQVGDQIFFSRSGGSECDHTGIVTKIADGRVYTIEGNTSGGSGVIANGGGVFAKSYPLGYSQIAGYGRPNYKLYQEEHDMTAAETQKMIAEEFARLNPAYKTLEDVPSYWRQDIKELMERGILKGDGRGNLNLTQSEAKAAVLVKRAMEAGL